MNRKTKSVPREEVELRHVETRKQQVDEEALKPLKELQKEIIERELNEQELSPIDRALLASFQRDRMILERIWIVLNQSRQILGEPPLSLEEVKRHLDNLVERGFLEYQEVEFENKINHVYILTEKGKEETL